MINFMSSIHTFRTNHTPYTIVLLIFYFEVYTASIILICYLLLAGTYKNYRFLLLVNVCDSNNFPSCSTVVFRTSEQNIINTMCAMGMPSVNHLLRIDWGQLTHCCCSEDGIWDCATSCTMGCQSRWNNRDGKHVKTREISLVLSYLVHEIFRWTFVIFLSNLWRYVCLIYNITM